MINEICINTQRELFLSEVNNMETIVAIEANNDTYCLQNRIEKFALMFSTLGNSDISLPVTTSLTRTVGRTDFNNLAIHSHCLHFWVMLVLCKC